MRRRDRLTAAEVAKLRRMMAADDRAQVKLAQARADFAREQQTTIMPPRVWLDKEPLDQAEKHGQEF